MYMLELKDRSWLKKHKLFVFFFYSQQSMCFLSVIQLTLSIIGYWTTIYLVSYEWKWRSYIWLRILKYYTNVCNCKVCQEKYFKCLKIQLFFHCVWKGCMISVRFTILLCVLFFFFRRNYYGGNWASFSFSGLLSWIKENQVKISQMIFNVL